MASVIVAAKLEALRECLARIESRTPSTVEALVADIDRQESLVLNLVRAVQVTADIGTHLLSRSDRPVPGTTAEVFTGLAALGAISDATAARLVQAVGFRNLAVHRYDTIDWALVHLAACEAGDDFKRFAREIAVFSDGS